MLYYIDAIFFSFVNGQLELVCLVTHNIVILDIEVYVQ